VESGIARINSEHLERIIIALDVDAEQAQKLDELRHRADERGRWQEYSDIVVEAIEMLVEIGEDATMARSYDIAFVQGLLQTRAYAEAVIGSATAATNSVSRSVKSRPARTMPAAPQHTPSARNSTRSSRSSPKGRHTLLSLALRSRSRSGKSDSLATGSLRRASVANVCGSSAEYSASASRGSYSGGMRVSPLTMVLIGGRQRRCTGPAGARPTTYSTAG
jgi:hypothetical protein